MREPGAKMPSVDEAEGTSEMEPAIDEIGRRVLAGGPTPSSPPAKPDGTNVRSPQSASPSDSNLIARLQKALVDRRGKNRVTRFSLSAPLTTTRTHPRVGTVIRASGTAMPAALVEVPSTSPSA